MKKLADIEAVWGPPANVEQTGNGVIWYYYFYHMNRGTDTISLINGVKRESGWWLGSIIADKEGTIIKMGTYQQLSDAREKRF